METVRISTGTRRARGPLGVVALLAIALLAFAALAPATKAATVTTYVQYSVSSKPVTAGGHAVTIFVSRTSASSTTSLSVRAERVDDRDTESADDDVSQNHSWFFSLPLETLAYSDDLGSAVFKSGSLAPAAGAPGRAYGKIELTATDLGDVSVTRDKCDTDKSRPATLTGVINFNTFLEGIGRIRRVSVGGLVDRYASKDPCDTPSQPTVCVRSVSMYSFTYDEKTKASSSFSIYRATGPIYSDYVSASFNEAADDTAPATVGHSIYGPAPGGSLIAARTLRTGKVDGGLLERIDGVITFAANAPVETYDGGDCPDSEQRDGALFGVLTVRFDAGTDYKHRGKTATLQRRFAS